MNALTLTLEVVPMSNDTASDKLQQLRDDVRKLEPVDTCFSNVEDVVDEVEQGLDRLLKAQQTGNVVRDTGR